MIDLATLELFHEVMRQRDEHADELKEERELTAKLLLDLRSATDRLREARDRIADLEDARRQPAQPSRLVLLADRPHHGPPGRCNCGVVHGPKQSIALNARQDGS